MTRKSNPYNIKLDPEQLQRLLQPTVKPLPATKSLHCDPQGRVRLYCTRNYERGCVVLRVRTQSAPNERNVVRQCHPSALLVVDMSSAGEYCRLLDALVDMVRLQYPDRQFVVQKKYPGQYAV